MSLVAHGTVAILGLGDLCRHFVAHRTAKATSAEHGGGSVRPNVKVEPPHEVRSDRTPGSIVSSSTTFYGCQGTMPPSPHASAWGSQSEGLAGGDSHPMPAHPGRSLCERFTDASEGVWGRGDPKRVKGCKPLRTVEFWGLAPQNAIVSTPIRFDRGF